MTKILASECMMHLPLCSKNKEPLYSFQPLHDYTLSHDIHDPATEPASECFFLPLVGIDSARLFIISGRHPLKSLKILDGYLTMHMEHCLCGCCQCSIPTWTPSEQPQDIPPEGWDTQFLKDQHPRHTKNTACIHWVFVCDCDASL